MALLGWEGFDNMSTNPQSDLIYKPFGTGSPTGPPAKGYWWGYFSGFGTISKQAGLFGGGCLGGQSTSGPGGLQLNASYATLVVGFRLKAPSLPIPSPLYPIAGFFDGSPYTQAAGTLQVGLGLNPAGNLFLFRGGTMSAPGTTLATGPTQLITQSWYMVEVALTINNAAGSYEVRLGGASGPSEMGPTGGVDTQTTANASFNAVSLHPNGFNLAAAFFDDFYITDPTGPAPWNTFLGNVRVETYFPTANNVVAWTPLAGTNWQEVSEPNMDSNTTYNSTIVPATDLYGHGSTALTPITIFGVSVCSCARKSDVKSLQFRNKIVSGATTVNGVTSALATGYTYTNDQFVTDPNTGLAWTTAGLNGTIIGYERVT